VAAMLSATIFNAKNWLKLIRRTRWLSISLMVLYAYATSGEAVWGDWAEWSPTKEGVHEGLIQLARLHCALAALSVLLGRLNQTQLMAGLYMMTYPLKFFAISRDRLVVRLALTLSYAENSMSNLKLTSVKDFQRLFDREEVTSSSIQLHLEKFNAINAFILFVATGLTVGALR
jgi:energy-coupling factor transport system permease protein